MSRWGSFYYGSGQLWGAETSDAIAWGVEVDWDGDGTFDGSNEASRMIGITTFRGRRTWLNTSGSGFQPLETGTVTITLTNSDGRYDSLNTASPLYPNVTQGRDVRIRAVDLSTNTIYNVFYGVITDIQAGNYQNEPTAVLRIEDGWRNLRRAKIYMNLQESQSVQTLISNILTAINWPARWGSSIDATSDTLPFFWTDDSNSAGNELERLASSFLGQFYLAADGTARYKGRAVNSSPVLTLSQEQISKDVYVSQPWENIRTVTRVRTHNWKKGTLTTIYENTTPMLMEYGEVYTVWTNFLYNNVPVAAQVFSWYRTGNTARDGTGSVAVIAGGSLGVESAMMYPVQMWNDDPSKSIYMTLLRVSGYPVYETSAATWIYPTNPDTDSDARDFTLDTPWIQDSYMAKDFSRVLGAFLAANHSYLVIKLLTRPDLQFVPDLFDDVTITIDKLGIVDAQYRVGGIEHKSTGPNCQEIITTLYLEPFITGTYWTWPVTNFGVDTIFAW